MANEIQFSASLQVANGTTVSLNASASATMAGADFIAGTQAIGTTTEAITLGDVATPGYIMIKNTDATNFVQIGLATPVTAGDAFAKLLPGEFCLVPTRQTVIYALADTAPVNIQKIIVEL